MPGKELTVEDGEVRDTRKYYPCPHCDAVRGTEEGRDRHVELKHSEAQ
jgi:uncharacterized C2H2 Zn-finger protein